MCLAQHQDPDLTSILMTRNIRQFRKYLLKSNRKKTGSVSLVTRLQRLERWTQTNKSINRYLWTHQDQELITLNWKCRRINLRVKTLHLSD